MKETLHIYTRVSSSAQEEDGTSLDSQKELGRKKAKQLGLKTKVWDEGGQSSKFDDLENRPKLVELLSEIEDGNINHLFVYNTDRLSRNQRTWGMIRVKLLEKGVTLHTSSGKMELKNPMDDLLLGILSEISQYDNKIRAERSRHGRFQKIQQGNWRGGPPPFGYRVEDKKVVVDEFESEWVKKIFDWYLNGDSAQDIRSKLDLNGVRTRRSKPTWSIGSIQAILKNPFYAGHYEYTDKMIGETVQIPTPPILDQVTFESAQKKRQRASARSQQVNRTKRFYLLRDFLVCGHCETPMGGRVNKGSQQNFYYCTKKEKDWKTKKPGGKKWKRGANCSMTRSINIAKTDELVWNTVVDVHRASYFLKEEYRQDFLLSVAEVREETDDSIARLKNKLRRMQKERARVEETLAKFETDILLRKTSADPKLMRSNLTSERDRVDQELEATKAEIEWKESQKTWVDWLDRFNSEVEQKKALTDQEKKEYLAGVIEEIRVYFDEEVNRHNLEIEFKVPIVGDQLIYKDPKRKAKGWTIQEGETVLLVQELELSNRGRPRLKKQETDGKE